MLTKSKIMAGLQCPKRLWLLVHRKDLVTQVDSPAIRQGNEVDRVAMDLFPGGVLIDGSSLQIAMRKTARAIAESKTHIYQATVASAEVLIKADILSRTPDGWVLTEVKAATDAKPEHRNDIATQFWVLREAGIPITTAQLAHVDRDFVYPGQERYGGVLRIIDLTAEVEPVQQKVAEWVGMFRTVLRGGEPFCDIGSQCSRPVPCEFTEYCDPYQASRHRPDVLPRINGRKLATWRERGITELADVPDDEINALQQRVKRAHLESSRFIGASLADTLGALPYPRYYLDFETSNPALPRFAGMRPYRHIAFQWSCHFEPDGAGVEHRSYLVPDEDDPRERFITSLIAALGDDGPICVWHAPFEKARLGELAEDFPAYAGALSGIADRVVDLLPIFVEHYYDPRMGGSWSIKKVLPTVDPSMSYDTLLGIQEGGAAMDAYLELLQPDCTAERRREIRIALERYCFHDTMAMLRLVQFGGDARATDASASPKSFTEVKGYGAGSPGQI